MRSPKCCGVGYGFSRDDEHLKSLPEPIGPGPDAATTLQRVYAKARIRAFADLASWYLQDKRANRGRSDGATTTITSKYLCVFALLSYM
jgi:hypothetical protein